MPQHDSRVIVLGLARGAEIVDAFVEGDAVVLVPVGPRRSSGAPVLGPLLVLVGWIAALWAKVGLRRMPFVSAGGLSEHDDALSRRRLRLKDLPLRELQLVPGSLRLLTAGLHVRVIEGGEAPLIELSRGILKEPLVLEAAGDPPDRLVRLLRDRGAQGVGSQ